MSLLAEFIEEHHLHELATIAYANLITESDKKGGLINKVEISYLSTKNETIAKRLYYKNKNEQWRSYIEATQSEHPITMFGLNTLNQHHSKSENLIITDDFFAVMRFHPLFIPCVYIEGDYQEGYFDFIMEAAAEARTESSPIKNIFILNSRRLEKAISEDLGIRHRSLKFIKIDLKELNESNLFSGRSETLIDQALANAHPLNDIDQELTSISTIKQEQAWKKTDTGNKNRFLHLHGSNLRFIKDNDDWAFFDNHRWRFNEQNYVTYLTEDVSDLIFQEASLAYHEGDEEEGKDLLKWSTAAQGVNRRKAIVELAKLEPKLQLKISDMDPEDEILNTPGHAINLRTGEVTPNKLEHYFTRITNTKYDPKAKCPVFDKFLLEFVGYYLHTDPSGELTDKQHECLEIRDFLLRLIGYAATGLTREKKICIFTGDGNDGKSLFLTTIQNVLGEWAKQGTNEVLIHSDNNRISDHIASLVGYRMVICSETERGQRLSEAQIKHLTSGLAEVEARFLHKNLFRFKPKALFFLDTNNLPEIRGTDDAIWSRIINVVCPLHLREDQLDRDLPNKLQNESSGILNRIIEGAQAYFEKGLQIPESINRNVSYYRNQMDYLSDFIENHCDRNQGYSCLYGELYEAYKTFCHEDGLNTWSKQHWAKEMAKRGHKFKKSNGERKFPGIRPRFKPADSPGLPKQAFTPTQELEETF